MSQPEGDPDISVIILNYNGAKWLDRCLATLRQQTIFQRIAIVGLASVRNREPEFLIQRNSGEIRFADLQENRIAFGFTGPGKESLE